MAKKAVDALTPDRFTPANTEAEQAVLGSALIDPDVINILIDMKLKPEHFYNEKNGWIYTCFLDLHGQGTAIDFVTACDALERRKQIAEVGGAAYVMDLINAVPTSIHARYYGEIVRKTGLLRNLIRATGQIAQLAYDETAPIETVFGQAQSIMFEATSEAGDSRVTSTAQAMEAVVDGIERAQRYGSGGVPSGFTTLDRYLGGGFQKGTLSIIGGRPSMGKTALALGLALNAARHKVPVAIFSMEMSVESLVHRLISSIAYQERIPESKIPYLALRSGNFSSEAWGTIIEASGKLADLPIYIDDAPKTLPMLRSGVMRMVGEHGAGLVIIDYLQRIKHTLPGENRVREVADITQTLKDLTMSLQIPILTLAQLNRSTEGRKDPRPRLADLRESGDIEADADVVLFPFRPYVYDDTQQPDRMDIIIAKQRNGPIGDATVIAQMEYNHFDNLLFNSVQRTELNPA